MLRFVLICAISVWALPLDVSAQDPIGETDIQGASLVGNYWGGIFHVKKCSFCSEAQDEDKAGPYAAGYMVRVYRADAEEGTITVSASMDANKPFRAQLGESVDQGIFMVHPFNSTTVVSDTGPPSKALQTQLSFDWSKDRCQARVPISFQMGTNVFPGVELWLHGTWVVLKIQVQIIILPPQPSLIPSPADAPAQSGQPWLINRLDLGYNFRASACGINPFLQLDQLYYDNVWLDEVPFETVNEYTEKQLDPGTFMTRRNQPSGEPRIKPSNGVDPASWLYSPGDCCRPSQYAPFAFPVGNPFGLRLVTVEFKPIETEFESTPPSDMVSAVTLESEFIVFGPEVSLSSTVLSPGRTVVATGTGFPPSSQIKVFAKVPYLILTPFERGERQIELGTASTNLDGEFSERFNLPPAGNAFWSDVRGWNFNPPTPQSGILRFYIDNVGFHLNYDYLDPDERFCHVDAFPDSDADTECPIKTGVITSVEFVKPAETVFQDGFE